MQANFGQMETALHAIQQFVPQKSTVLDLHAGVGVIGGADCILGFSQCCDSASRLDCALLLRQHSPCYGDALSRCKVMTATMRLQPRAVTCGDSALPMGACGGGQRSGIRIISWMPQVCITYFAQAGDILK